MATLKAAKQALRREIKQRVAALSMDEKRRQSLVVSHKMKLTSWIPEEEMDFDLSEDEELSNLASQELHPNINAAEIFIVCHSQLMFLFTFPPASLPPAFIYYLCCYKLTGKMQT